MRISDWSSDVCSSDLRLAQSAGARRQVDAAGHQIAVEDAVRRLDRLHVGDRRQRDAADIRQHLDRGATTAKIPGKIFDIGGSLALGQDRNDPNRYGHTSGGRAEIEGRPVERVDAASKINIRKRAEEGPR